MKNEFLLSSLAKMIFLLFSYALKHCIANNFSIFKQSCTIYKLYLSFLSCYAWKILRFRCLNIWIGFSHNIAASVNFADLFRCKWIFTSIWHLRLRGYHVQSLTIHGQTLHFVFFARAYESSKVDLCVLWTIEDEIFTLTEACDLNSWSLCGLE